MVIFDWLEAAEAIHLAHLMAAHGYFFPVEDHILTVKNDGTLYRFQVMISIERNSEPID